MAPWRDPIERAADEDEDLYGVATWEPRTLLDRLVTRVYGGIRPFARAFLIALSVAILAGSLLEGLRPAITDPTIRALVVLSVVPALFLALYVMTSDVTTGEPVEMVVVTFVLGVLFASFAAVVNTTGGELLTAPPGSGEYVVELASAATFFLVVAPAEEVAKLLAVRLHAYRDPRFDAVIDGAVYGAVAGLGFATIENALYISTELSGTHEFGAIASITAVRALAGPGHVIYSAIAGYYLGLAKFNEEYAGPLVIKGLVVAAVLHGTYNTLVAVVPFGLADAVGWLSVDATFVGFVLTFDGLAGLYLYRLIRRYRRTYHRVQAAGEREGEIEAELAEFERSVGDSDPGGEDRPDRE